MFSDITAKKQAEETIWQQANYDQLTGLPNRRLFRDRLRQDLLRAQRQQGALALMFVDLDRFKEINETLGHEAGDRLLIEAARRISACARDSDTVARLGSDEFAVTLVGVPEPGEVERVANTMLHALSQPFELGPEAGYISACIGVTLFPADGEDIETLLKNADQAMHVAKGAGLNNFSWFTLDMQLAAQARRTLLGDLRNALASDQLRVFYQPIVDLQSGLIVKAEALIRWQHPTQGLISPAVFIPLAEEVGLIEEIGDWVFRTAARQAKAWQLQGRPLQVSINKSPRQFGGSYSGATWLQFLQEIDLPPQFLVIEITEGLLLDQRDLVTEQLLSYRKAGIEIAVDDFGTGYSALSYLQRFDIDYLKIDRSFIMELAESADVRALADAIIVMAHKLGLKVIAEGVEAAAQRDWLISSGCDYVQGFLYARPLPAEEFNALLRQG
jgi:diguanylate cyclase (GGDEF)-like protein